MVLGLIAIVTGLAASGLRGPSGQLTLEAAIASLEEQVATQRNRALIGGQLVEWRPHAPHGFELDGCVEGTDVPEILFRPDG